ncbi:MAG: alpha/beta hydrolase [Patescibacteria group bacterium]|jgi:predicted alpha/beta hydrolase family esterase|nr:alpha/beta hydrolase [Patescibacteria group bacterium]
MSSKVIIVHCWDGFPDYCWYPYVKNRLTQSGFQVSVPVFPETGAPKLNLWLPKLREEVGIPNNDIFLVGHSIGCATILRYLESLTAGQKIGGVVLVAGFTHDLGYKELNNFFVTPLDLAKIRTHCDNFLAINSDNDQYVDLQEAQIFKEKLSAQIIVKPNAGHFSGEVDSESACTSLPEVVDYIIKIAK